MISKIISLVIVAFYFLLAFLRPEKEAEALAQCSSLAFLGLLLVWFADYMEYVVGWLGHGKVDGYQPAIIIQILGWIIIVFIAPILYLIQDSLYF